MAKTLFHTTEKSNFILNLDLERYRSMSAGLMLAALWTTAVSEAVNQATAPVNADFAIMIDEGGGGMILAMLLLALRSVATLFSILGVLVMIWTFIGVVRRQYPKTTVPLYLLLGGAVLWGVASLCHSYSVNDSLFGQDGRDEGLIALTMYFCMFYLGTMLRRGQYAEKFFRGLFAFGIVQNVWAILQMLPVIDFPNEYKMIDPLLYQNLRLPSGMTDSPGTFAMLLAMLIAVSVPAAYCAKKPVDRLLALLCAGLSFLSVFKTQTIPGWIAGIGGAVILCIVLIAARKRAQGKKWLLPVVALVGICGSLVWTYFTPAINGAYKTFNEEALPNGFAVYDGGLVWDDSYYRLTTSGPYSNWQDHDFDIYDSVSVLRFCWKEGVRAIRIDPIFGVGPDNFSYTQYHSSMTLVLNANTIDRPYNDYLFIAGTRGILSLVIHLAVVVWSLYLAWKKRREAYGWIYLSAAGGAVLYSLTAIVGVSVLTVAPLFWMLLGTSAAELLPEGKVWQKQRKPKKKKKKQPAEEAAGAE